MKLIGLILPPLPCRERGVSIKFASLRLTMTYRGALAVALIPTSHVLSPNLPGDGGGLFPLHTSPSEFRGGGAQLMV